MARMVVMYKTPKDGAAFDKHYFSIHVPLAQKIPGLRKFETSQGPVSTPAGPSPFHMIVTLDFDDMAAIKKGLASAEGQATVTDVQNFAPEPPDILFFESREL